jgi:hypothetical protein
MLFKHLTWQQFLVAAVILSCAWYALLYLVIYKWRKPGGAAKAVEPLRHEWDEELEEAMPEETRGLMGERTLPEGMSRVSMSELRFAPGPEEGQDETIADESRRRQQGLIPDAVEELKSIFHILEREQGSKADFFSLFGLVRVKYTGLTDADRHALNGYIRENVLFPLSDEELTNLWA